MDILKKLFANHPLILASNSPRRQALFRAIGLDFSVHLHDIEEVFFSFLAPHEIVTSLAFQKAQSVAQAFEHGCIVSADTIVVLGNTILGKPEHEADAEQMLLQLSGKTHQVFTGYTVYLKPEDKHLSEFEQTSVTFHQLTREEIRSYIATKSPLDKAGSYGIQDAGAVFVKKIDGCFYNVMGFPLAHFYQTCRTFLQKKGR